MIEKVYNLGNFGIKNPEYLPILWKSSQTLNCAFNDA